MKTLRFALACVALSVSTVWAAEDENDEIGRTDDAATRDVLSPGEIETLVAPVALYPDPLLALILPASTRPSDVVLAARFMDRGGSPEAATTEPWDDSVKALTRYREVLTYLDTNLEWTRRLGECFLHQPDDVMGAVQSVRARARTAGLLTNTPQQEVVYEDEEIRIVPAQPTVIYVPRYDPQILYYTSSPNYYYAGSFLTFGVGYGIGSWLSYDCDWRYRYVRIVQRPPTWYYQPDWRHRHLPSVAYTRWAPRYDRHNYDHRRPGYDRTRPTDRRWNHTAGQSSANNRTVATPQRERTGDWQRPRGPEATRDRFDGSRDRNRPTRPDYQGRPRREISNPITAPEAASSAAAALTAPELAAQSPAATAPAVTSPPQRPAWNGNRHSPRRDDATPRREDRPRATPDRPRRENYQPVANAGAALAPSGAPAPRYSAPPARTYDAAPRASRSEGRSERSDTPRRADRPEENRREQN